MQGFDTQFTDGVILSPLALRPRDLQDRDTRLPLVLLGECNLPGSADHVAIDNVAAAREATAHLLARGRRRVAVVGGDLHGGLNTGRLRTVGYEQALAEAGLAVSEELVLPVPAFRWADGAAAARVLMRLPQPPDALLCLNDHLALGAVRALHEDGWSVPGTWTWSGSTTSRPPATASRRSPRSPPTSRASRGGPSNCCWTG